VTIGLDTNILCYALDPAYPEHQKVKDLLVHLSPENLIALNPTVLHEAYHTLVFYLEWTPEETARKLTALLKHPYIEFYKQTPKTNPKQKHNHKHNPTKTNTHKKPTTTTNKQKQKTSVFSIRQQNTPKQTMQRF